MNLEILGHQTRVAFDGEQAVSTAREFQPDAILLDIGMPKLDGYAACRLIRQQPWGQRVKMIALTGWGQEEDRRRTQEAGFDHHLVKPVDMSLVTRLLEDAAVGAEKASARI
jgi:CheY-like chemotaxis protein